MMVAAVVGLEAGAALGMAPRHTQLRERISGSCLSPFARHLTFSVHSSVGFSHLEEIFSL